MNKINSAQKIFEKFSDDFYQTMNDFNLKHIDGDGNILDCRGLYVCPLSLHGYNIKDIDKLSIEHVPQNSLKGKPIILTDKELNNKDGSTKDKKILNYFKFRNFNSGIGELDIKLSAPNIINGNLSGKLVQISKTKDKTKIIFGFPYKTFKMLEERELFNQWDGLKLGLKFTYTNIINRSAIMKAAYLIAFSRIGYKLLYNENGLKTDTYLSIIEQLQNDVVYEAFPFLYYEELDINMPDELGVLEAGDIKLLLVKVVYKLEDKKYLYYCILPHPNDISFDNVLKFKELIKDEKLSVNVRAINKDYLMG